MSTRADTSLIKPARLLNAGLQAICSAAVSYLFLTIPVRPFMSKFMELIFTKFFMVGSTMAADDQSEISFSILKGRCHSNQFLW